MNFKTMGANLGLEEDEFLELVELFLETADNDIQRIKAAYADGDGEKVAEAAHSLKGAAGNLGFLDMYEAARSAEAKGKENDINNLNSITVALGEMLLGIKNNVVH